MCQLATPPNATRVEAKSKVTIPYNCGMFPLYVPSPIHTKLYNSLYTSVLNFLQGGGREKRGDGKLFLSMKFCTCKKTTMKKNLLH